MDLDLAHAAPHEDPLERHQLLSAGLGEGVADAAVVCQGGLGGCGRFGGVFQRGGGVSDLVGHRAAAALGQARQRRVGENGGEVAQGGCALGDGDGLGGGGAVGEDHGQVHVRTRAAEVVVQLVVAPPHRQVRLAGACVAHLACHCQRRLGRPARVEGGAGLHRHLVEELLRQRIDARVCVRGHPQGGFQGGDDKLKGRRAVDHPRHRFAPWGEGGGLLDPPHILTFSRSSRGATTAI